MTSKAPVSPAYLAPFALCVALLGGWAIYQESTNVVLEPGLSNIARVVRTLGTKDIGGVWTRTQQSALQSCQAALQTRKSLEMRFLPPETQASLGPHCLQIALSAAADFPTDSYAWSVAALASADLRDWAAMNAYLVRSQLTGPTEQWIAELRVTVAQDNFAVLDDAARVAAEQDLRLLVISIPGIRQIARRYINDLEFRARIEALVETMPAENQRRFVSVVRREMQ